MKDINKILASLSPEKRALLEKRLKQKNKSSNAFPLSFAQKRLWFLDQFDPESIEFNIPSAIELRGILNHSALQSALNEIEERHEILRTKISTNNDNPVQVIHKPIGINVELKELDDKLSEEEKDAKVKELIQQKCSRKFSLTSDRLFDVSLIKINEKRSILLLVMHHIITDGWSVGVFIKEFSILYDKYLNKSDAALPKLTIQYGDYSKWQEKWIDSPKFKTQLEFWKNYLGDKFPVLELPTDFTVEENKSYKADSVIKVIPKNTSERIKDLCSSYNITSFVFYAGIINVLLSKYSSQKEIFIGIPVANRKKKETQDLIGFFVNMVVLRSKIQTENTFKEFTEVLRKDVLEILDNQEVPFELLVEELQPERNLNSTPIFRVMYSYATTGGEKLTLPGLELAKVDIDFKVAQYDLTFNVNELPNGETNIILEFSKDLFLKSKIEKLVESFTDLINNVFERPDLKIRDIDLISNEEKEIIQSNFNISKTTKFKNIHKRIEEHVEKFPNDIALKDNNLEISYEELNHKSNCIANYLLSRKINNKLIAVLLDSSSNYISSIFGILKSGNAFVPIDVKYPGERISSIINDAEIEYIVTLSDYVDLIENFNGKIIQLDIEEERINICSSQNLEMQIHEHQLAYCIYTSGSTGKPKGVQISHLNLNTFSEASREVYKIDRNDKLFQFASISFDTSIEEIFLSLLSGATLVINNEKKLADAHELLRTISEEQISVLDFPTAYWNNFSQQLLQDNLQLPACVRKVIVGGEKVNRNSVINLGKYSSHSIEFFNGYGPTETTVIATVWNNCVNNTSKIINEIPIGKSIPGYNVYILDENLYHIPIGASGELFISGNAVSQGYINNPELTANSFLPDPYDNAIGQRMYSTGDVVKFLEDGNIEFIGRKDNQIKIRGYRVELEEIESIISQHLEVSECKVLIKSVSQDNKRIVAFLTFKNLDTEIEDIKKSVAKKIPSYMIPSEYHIVDSIPLKITGKVDTDKLLELAEDNIEGPKESKILNETEELLLSITSEILGNQNLLITDNFFNSGGHSLLATQLTSRIRREFGLDFPIRKVFEAINIEDIAKEIELLKNTDIVKNIIPKVEQKENIPLSFAQQRLWFLDQIEKESPFYNIPFAIRLKGELNLEYLQKSIDNVVERHEILRTTFSSEEGTPVQVIHSKVDSTIDVRDLRTFSVDEREKKAKEICDAEIQIGFSLKEIPLFKITCIIIDEDEFILVTSIHHIISDGWSSNVLMREVSLFYSSYLKGITSEIPPLEIQYSDYSIWQRNWLNGEELEKRINFWKKYFDTVPTILKLPLDKKRPEVQTYNGNIIEVGISNKENERIAEINTECGTTPFMFFLSLFSVLLYRLTNQDEIIIGTPVANREAPEVQNLIGIFVNTIGIRTSIPEINNFKEFLKLIRQRSIDAFANKDLPFEKIIDSVNIERNPSYSPLFQVMFTFNPFEKSENNFDGIKSEEFEFRSITSKFDLSLTVQETEDKSYNLGFEYNTDLFEETTIKRWLDYYKELLHSVLTNQAKPLHSYSLSSNIVLKDSNNVELEDENFILRFKHNVEKYPNKVAVSQLDKNILYAEFNRITDNFAIELKQHGIMQGDFVGIYLDRSIEAIVSMISILKIGAAFIPIDTKYPEDRINYIIKDSKLSAIIISSTNERVIKSTKNISISSFKDYLNDEETHIDYNYEKILPAYVIYTSGTTGNPKGVLVSNKNLNSFIKAASKDYGISENDKILQFSSLSFDTSIEEIFPILYQGGSIELRTDDVLESNQNLLNIAKEKGITILDMPTAYWHQLTNEMIEKNLTFHPELHTLITGGEKASKEIFDLWFENFGENINYLNTYGPTEGTVVATYWSSKKIKNEYSEELPIGDQLSNSNVFVLDADFNIVPTGVIGQLYIGGESVSYGYLNDTAKTAQQFIPNPFSSRNGDRLYKSGDLVRRLPSGNIEFIGRADNQIKIRGFRVEISEIENSITKLEFVNENAVINKIEGDRNRLICFYTSQNKEEKAYDEFVAKLKTKLPNYMIPSSFIRLEQLPITVNGKVDKKQLSQRKIEVVKTTREIVKPTNEREEIIFNVWKEVLGKDEFGVTNNFFELGGDSIIGIQIISKVRQSGLILKPVHLFQHQTIRELAAVASEGTVIKAEQGLIEGTYKMLPIQKIFFEQKFEKENHWNQSLLFRIEEHLNASLLEKTVLKIIEHHDALRTRKINEDENSLLIGSDLDGSKHFEHIIIDGKEDNIGKAIENICNNAQSSLNLVNGPIFKVIYIELPNNESRVFIVAHHIAVDGVSWRILIEDFQSIYSQLSDDKEVKLPLKTSSFNEWANILFTYSNSDKIENDINYWKKISENKTHEILEKYSGENTEESSISDNVILSEEITENLLTKVNDKYNTKINDILLTALLKSYSNWSGKRSLIVNLEGHGRENLFEDLDISRTVGWFTSIYPLFLDMKKSVSLADLIPTVKEQIRNIPNNGFTYGLLRYLSSDDELRKSLKNIENDFITFNYLGQLDNIMNEKTLFKIANESKGFERDPKNKRESIIDITGSVVNKKLSINFSYSSNCISKDRIADLIKNYENDLKKIIDHCMNVEKKKITASDFSMAKLNDKKLNSVLSKLKKK